MFKATLHQVQTYEAGKPIELVMREYGVRAEDIIKLGSNENPHGTSPRALQALRDGAHRACYYPDDSMLELKTALSGHYGVRTDEILVSAGSDQGIELCLQAVDHSGACAIAAKITFAMYGVYAKLAGVELCRTPSDEHRLDEFRALILDKKREGVRVSVIFLCLPNNPLGECVESKQVWEFLEFVERESGDSLVLLDGAYQEFAAYKDSNMALPVRELIARFKNVVYLGTFSKLYGLGGMRIGYAIAQGGIMQTLYKVRPPFNVSTLSLLAARAALEDRDFITHTLSENLSQMARYEDFATRNNLSFIPSFTNFITLFLGERAQGGELCEWLLKQGVIIRNLASYGLNAVRITIGTSAQNARVLGLLESYLRQ